MRTSWKQTLLRVVATVNFVGILAGVLIWYSSCSRDAPRTRDTHARAVNDVTLTSFAQVADCLDRRGGVVRGTCRIPASVRDVEIGAGPNDKYFAATKAAVPITWTTGEQAVAELKEWCRSTSSNQQAQAPQAQAANPPAAPGSSSLFACVIAELERRTTPGAPE